MGKTKTKYPVDIIIEFCLINSDSSYLQKEVVLKVHSSPLVYENVKGPYQQFVHENQITYQTIMECQIGDQSYEFDQQFSLEIPKLFQNCGNRLCIIVRSFLQTIKEQIDAQLQQIRNDIGEIYKRLSELPTRQQFELMKKNASSLPVLAHGNSIVNQPHYEQRELDLGVLFSQPIFDQNRKKTATPPVDFRSEIQRLHIALKSSMKSNITVKCQIATRQNLKHLIKFSKPKILHIICHGTKEGSLQFEDDSRTIVGTLQIIKKQDIQSILKTVSDTLPQIVFINSCYSQHIGQMFFSIGVKYVIMIDSQDKIEDQAAQIFSQHFYRNIFSGQKVGEAFKDSKQRVKMKHNSFGCCCRHSSKQKHKQNCRWTKVIKKQFTQIQGHRLFHVPSQICQCQLRNLNRHKLTCQWAKQALFNINNDFRVKDAESGQFRFPKKAELPKYLPKDQLVICCCFNYEGAQDESQFRLPHSESNKFKMLPSSEGQKTDPVFSIIPSNYKQLVDYTSPQLIQTHQKIDTSILGRQQQVYEFMKKLKQLNQNIFIIYGPLGVGRTSFALKSTTYLIERKCFQMYFYIDLYDIKDRDIFRYKFNEVTKFSYNGEIRLTQVKNKMIIIILDNADQFLVHQKDQLYQELKNLRSQLHKSKIILTFKQQNCLTFDFEKIHSEKFHLESLSNNMATRLIFSKMRHLFDISVDHSEVYALVAKNQTLRIPKIIESVCQSFSSTKGKIRAEDIRKKLQQIGDYDFASSKLIQQNLKLLQEKSQESYDLLLFISQFSQGISRQDFKILSLYQKKDSYIHLPIGKNWEQSFANLFQKYKFQKQSIDKDANTDASSVTTEEQSDMSTPNPQLKNAFSYEFVQLNSINSDIKMQGKLIKGESYFLDQMSPNRFIVKRYIRDFIWKKHISQSNYYMKHLFVGYMSVMLQIYLRKLIQQNYVHQQLLQYSSLSQTGIFGIKSYVFNINASLTESVRFAKQYTSQFEKIISQHPTVRDKIKKSDPSVFILNHKQDFLNIYEKDWDAVLIYLRLNKEKQEKVLLSYLENLILFVPTAFKVAKVEPSLLRYVLSKSMNLLSRLKSYSDEKKILILTLKLQLMKVSLQLQKNQMEELRMNLEFNKDYNIKLLQKIDKNTLETLKIYWDFQKRFILMYKQFITKQMKSSLIDKGKYSSEKLKQIIQNLKIWMQEDWSMADPLLYAKRNLLVSLIYLNFIKNSSGTFGSHTFVLKFKKQYERRIIEFAIRSSKTLQNHELMKLCLRAKLTAIQLFWLLTNSKKKSKEEDSSQFYEELSQRQKQILQCQQIFTTRKNNLIGFVQFQSQIKHLKKEMKNKLWEQSQNTIVFMRAVPVTSNGELPIIQHLARKKNKFRKQIQRVVDQKIDLCTKFQILTKQKLKQELIDGCTILLMSTDVKLRGGKVYLVFEGQVMNEDLVQINEQFVNTFVMDKIKILILAGKNTDFAITRLISLIKDPPIMISLASKAQQEQFEQFEDFNHELDQDYLDTYLLKYQQRKTSQVGFVKQFIKNLIKSSITSKDDIHQIVKKSKSFAHKDLQVIIQSKKRTSPLVIQYVKGTYKDLSPGHQKNNNIDMNYKIDSTNFIILRRYKQTFRVLKYVRRYYNSEPVYVNIFGDIGSGKSCFVKQIARILVQRQFYEGGIYLIEGKILQKKYNGEFQAYFNKQSQTGKILTLQDFQKNGNQKFLLIIDDFHLIKPRSNGRFNLFLQKIIEKKVNLILVTHQVYKKDTFNKVKPIKIERLSEFEINLIAYNTLDLKNKQMMDSFEQLKRKKHGNVDVKQILQLKNKFNSKGKDKQRQLSEMNGKDFRKLISNQG